MWKKSSQVLGYVAMTINFKTLSLQDALDIAISIEEEAHERYLEFSQGIGSRYKGDAGEFFSNMAKFELKHAKDLSEKRQQLFKNAPVRTASLNIWNIEAPDHGDARTYMSPRQAALVALASEKKAYSFFDDALKSVENAEVRELFTELRGEEKQHQKMLEDLLKRLPEEEGPDLTDDDIDEPPAL